jgi:chromosome segregation ATPase
MDENFLNLYITKANERMSEQLKIEIMMRTQLDFAQKTIDELQQVAQFLKQENDTYSGQITELTHKVKNFTEEVEAERKSSMTLTKSYNETYSKLTSLQNTYDILKDINEKVLVEKTDLTWENIELKKALADMSLDVVIVEPAVKKANTKK